MRAYSLSHISDPELIRGLASAVAHHRSATATVLAYISEVDDRRLYVPAAYPSMHAYCVGELHMSEDAAYRRITAARVARKFPAIYETVADGRLHLTGVGLLAPYLTAENAADLLAAAAHKSKAGIEELLAARYPRSEALGLVTALPASAPDTQLAPGQVEIRAPELTNQLVPERVPCLSKVTPIAPERFDVRFTIGRETREKLQHAQELVSHALPSGDLAEVLDRALDALIEKLEKRKFAATSRPRRGSAFGAGPMSEKRESPQRAREARAREAARRRAQQARAAAEEAIAPLRSLGFSAEEARRAAQLCEAIPDSPLEHRVVRALTYFRRTSSVPPSGGRPARPPGSP